MKQITGNLPQEKEEADQEEAEVAVEEAEMMMKMTGKNREVPLPQSQKKKLVKREVIHTEVVKLEEGKKKNKSRLYLLPSLLPRLLKNPNLLLSSLLSNKHPNLLLSNQYLNLLLSNLLSNQHPLLSKNQNQNQNLNQS